MLDQLSAGLPGLRKGMELVLHEERWYIGFSSRIIYTRRTVTTAGKIEAAPQRIDDRRDHPRDRWAL